MADIASDFDFRSWLSRKTDVQATIRESNYSSWFSDRLSGTRMQGLYSKLQSAKGEDQKTAALLEGHAAMVLYSTLIYYVYPSMPSMKREIDSSPELRQNFSRLKGWFDQNGGSRIADDFYRELVNTIAERRSG